MPSIEVLEVPAIGYVVIGEQTFEKGVHELVWNAKAILESDDFKTLESKRWVRRIE